MSNDIFSYFENAQLSSAAYATLSVAMNADRSAYIEALFDAGMSRSQATTFAADYDILTPTYTDSSNGFAATLFRNKATGEKVLAIRGTQPTDLFDWLTNLSIFTGNVLPILQGQYQSLNNYYQQLLAGGQLSVAEAFTVTGHSLGGFLTQLFAVGNANVVAHAYTYNAPGIGGFLTQLGELFGITNANASGTNITNLQGSGPSATAGWGTLLGEVKSIYTEDQSPNYLANHLIKYSADSLAIYNLIAQLDPTLNTNPTTGLQKITDILKVSASSEQKTLETALAGLVTLFQENYRYRTANYSALTALTDDRDDFYTRLFALEDYLKGTPLNVGTAAEPRYNLTVDSLVNKSTAELFTAAKTDPAARYALYKLNPFIVSGTGLYETVNGDHSLDLYDATTRTGALTEEYLKDRVSFLYNKIVTGNQNKEADGKAWVQYTGSLQHFQDGTGPLSYQLYLGPDSSITGQSNQNISNIIFDDWTSNTLTGGDKWDKLYGLAGDDTLQGGKGNDYLEGGQGSDTYIYTSGDGLDTILDTDGLGKITFDGTILNGGDKLFGETYKSSDGKYLYTLLQKSTGQDWLISGMGGQVIVRDFQRNNLFREAA